MNFWDVPELHGSYVMWLTRAPADSKELVDYLYAGVGSGVAHLVLNIAVQHGWIKKVDPLKMRANLLRLSKSGRILDAVSEASEFVAAMNPKEGD